MLVGSHPGCGVVIDGGDGCGVVTYGGGWGLVTGGGDGFKGSRESLVFPTQMSWHAIP